MVARTRWQEPLSTLNPIKFFTLSQKCQFSEVGVSKTGDNFTRFRETKLISISPPLHDQHRLASSWLRNKVSQSKTTRKASPGGSLLCCPLWVWQAPTLMPVALGESCSERHPLRLTPWRQKVLRGQPPTSKPWAERAGLCKRRELWMNRCKEGGPSPRTPSSHSLRMHNL